MPTPGRGPLAGVRVVDVSTVVAGPGCARYLGDFGAEVIKVERPGGGDGARRMGALDPTADEPTSLWWRLLSRNKRVVSLDLKDPADRDVFEGLCDAADVLVENFRPGTLERLGLAPARLIDRNPRLVVTRVTGYGQTGPYRHRPGFATQAEAMGGWAAISGEPDGQPLLPPIALTDEVTGLAAAFATMVALHSGVGQEVDVNLVETMLQIMGPLVPLYGVLGELQARLGSGIPYTVPRNTYRCADGRWVAVSTSAESVAARVMELIGCGDDPRFAGFAGRVEHREEIDRRMSDWIGSRSQAEVLDAFEAAEAACAPVNDMAAIFADEHLQDRGAIVSVDGVPMPGLLARLSATPGVLRHAGRGTDADGAEVRAEVRDLRSGGGPGGGSGGGPAVPPPTARLVFQPVDERVWPFVRRLHEDAAFMRFRGGVRAEHLDRAEMGDGQVFVVCERTTGAPVGRMACRLGEATTDPVTLGWNIAPECQGRGLATEAARSLLAHARRLGRTAARAEIAEGNLASERVARALGMRPAGEATCEGVPSRVWWLDLVDPPV